MDHLAADMKLTGWKLMKCIGFDKLGKEPSLPEASCHLVTPSARAFFWQKFDFMTVVRAPLHFVRLPSLVYIYRNLSWNSLFCPMVGLHLTWRGPGSFAIALMIPDSSSVVISSEKRARPNKFVGKVRQMIFQNFHSSSGNLIVNYFIILEIIPEFQIKNRCSSCMGFPSKLCCTGAHQTEPNVTAVFALLVSRKTSCWWQKRQILMA